MHAIIFILISPCIWKFRGSRSHWSIGVLVLVKFQQLFRVLTTNIDFVLEVDLGRIEPMTSIFVGFVGIIDREENTVRTDLMDTVLQRRAGEMAGSGDPDILLEVLVDGLLAGLIQPEGLLDIFQPVIDTPKVKRQMLAQMSDDDLNPRKAVEDTVRNDAHQVQANVVGERKRRPDKVFAVLVLHVVEDPLRRRRMYVDGHIELLNDGPEGVVLGMIVEEDLLFALRTRGQLPIVQQRAMEAVIRHTTGQLSRRLVGVVHR